MQFLALQAPPAWAERWPLLALGAGLLLFPLPLLFGQGVKYRELTSSWDRQLKLAVQLPWHWIDLCRAFGGSFLLVQALALAPEVPYEFNKISLLIAGGVLAGAAIVQAVACKAPEGFHAPFAFVAGGIVPFFPPVMSLMALVGAVTIAMAFRSGAAFFGAVVAMVGLLGSWLYPAWEMLGIVAVFALLPMLLPVLFQRELVVAHVAPVEVELPDPR